MNRRKFLKMLSAIPVGLAGLTRESTSTPTVPVTSKGVSVEDACMMVKCTLKDMGNRGPKIEWIRLKYVKHSGETALAAGDPVCWKDDGTVEKMPIEREVRL
jgi:hypothetical protein